MIKTKYIPSKCINLEESLREFLDIPEITNSLDKEHIERTPKRIVNAMMEMVDGLFQTPEAALDTLFINKKYDEIVYINDISFSSLCAHHWLSFIGKMHFGYLPNKNIVGLSKIPRLINVYAKRPQVQENLTQEIVDSFMRIVKPKGCGLVVEAYHLCMSVRGVQQHNAYTKTTALRGSFKTNESTKQEFLNGIRKTTEQLWP
jgi:GTP cyclohydrolase I